MQLQPGPKDERRRVTVEQVEADYFEEVAAYLNRGARGRERLLKPLGFCAPEWEELKGMMQPGDELWECCSAKHAWDALTGTHSIELVRNGLKVGSILISHS